VQITSCYFARNALSQASEYLYPHPVLKSTTVSSVLIHPLIANYRAATTVAAPSGAAKIPSCEASSLPAASISSSVAAIVVPFVSRTPAKKK
jgi:hypothetical protein